MNLPHTPDLEVQYLSRLFDNTSECYKFFWFQAIVTKILEGKDIITYEELVNEMIADAWYMVTEYHLNLGPKDTLEVLVHEIQNMTQMRPSEKKQTILNYLSSCTEKKIMARKRTLTLNVPYRLQAPFMEHLKGKEWNVSIGNLIQKINQEQRLMYYFDSLNGMQTSIRIQPEWYAYVHKNQEIVKGWLQYHMIEYLQKRNPSVPGISDKLYPPQERKLDKVKRYWKLLLSLHSIQDIYGHEELTTQDMSIDHFVPWSYVAHDEFWNLHPTTREINSSKSNNLPDWKTYFPQLAKLEYFSYEMIWSSDAVHEEFEKCAREHLNNEKIRRRIYRQGLDYETFRTGLEEIVQPVYQSAKNCGFKSWIYSGENHDNRSDNIIL